jgi:hypothetical protein
MNGQRPLYILVQAIPGNINIKSYHWANNRGKYADPFHNSMIDDTDSNVPLPQIMFTFTALPNVLPEWQNITAVRPKPAK